MKAKMLDYVLMCFCIILSFSTVPTYSRYDISSPGRTEQPHNFQLQGKMLVFMQDKDAQIQIQGLFQAANKYYIL